MKNKCITQFTILSIFLFSILYIPFVSAETQEIKNTIYPDSILWNIDRGLEKVQLFWYDKITRNPTKLAEKKMWLSFERNLEMQQMVYENNQEGFQKSFNAFNKDLANIPIVVAQMPEGLQKNLQLLLNKSLNNLEDLQSQLPEASRQGLNNAIEIHQEAIQRTQTKMNEAFEKKYGYYKGILEAIDTSSLLTEDEEE